MTVAEKSGTNTPTITVTNQSGGDLAVVSAYSDDDASAQQVYNQTLSLLKTSSGNSTIASTAAADVVLVGATGQVIFDLLYSRPANLYPVCNASLLAIGSSPQALTVTAQNAATMTNAFTFIQTLSAYPSSSLAQNYAAAAQSASNSTSNQGIDSAMSAFFASTSKFKDLDVVTVTTAQTYLSAFPFGWAQSQAKYTYFLYAPGTASSGSDSASPSQLGTLTMVQKSNLPVPADPTDHSGGYILSFIDSHKQVTPLFYSNGQFVSSLTDDVPALCFKGLFTVKSQISGNTDDTEVLPILHGSINGVTVLGLNFQLPANDDSNEWYALFHPKNFYQFLQSTAFIVGVLMATEWIGSKLVALGKYIKNKWNGEVPKTQEQQLKELTDRLEANQKEFFDKMAERFGPQDPVNVPEPAALGPSIEELRANQVAELSDVQRDRLNDSIDTQLGQIEDLARISDTPALNEAASKLAQARDDLNDAFTPDEMQQALNEATTAVNDAHTTIGESIETNAQHLNQELKQQLDEAQIAVEDAQKLNEDTEAEKDGVKDGEFDEDLKPIEI
ncbi:MULTISPECIES: hypothetical protein [Pseudomonas]|uniref:Uncharacterized protein n=1 Tax=Pseudomonas koreensis TaxID=198620 RepID=A0AA94EU69_9PSED|nr:hypothetical protein [Pseudomonas koreensis]RVD79587.1 hypothetical protein A9HBioS_0111 [Pseudomonas koreensis]